MLKILIAPSNTLIDPDYGSEATWTYDNKVCIGIS
jgi:hypothetical protein